MCWQGNSEAGSPPPPPSPVNEAVPCAPSSFWDDTPQVTAVVPKWDEVPEAMLEKYLDKLFAIGDTNGDGALQFQEFSELLSRCCVSSVFTPEVVSEFFLQADENEDGEIEYDEFIQVMKAIINGCKAAANTERERQVQLDSWLKYDV